MSSRAGGPNCQNDTQEQSKSTHLFKLDLFVFSMLLLLSKKHDMQQGQEIKIQATKFVDWYRKSSQRTHVITQKMANDVLFLDFTTMWTFFFRPNQCFFEPEPIS